MNRKIIPLGVMIIASLIIACGSQAAPAPTAAPQSAPPAAQPAAPTVAPTRAPAAASTQAPAPAQPKAAGDVQVINILMTIYDMQPPEITVKAGSKVRFIIKNVDTEEHDMVSAGAKLRSILVDGGKTVETDWTAPDALGSYEAICTIHREIKPLIIKVVR